ncbi:MAG TPA: YqaE/Pmp3 family membrane protein [Patescibacteria group bacterium]
MSLIELLAAILVPPLAVWLKVGLTTHFWINVILTLLGYLPGIIHAFWVILTF